MPFLERLSELPAPIAETARITDDAGGAVLVFDSKDRIVLAKDLPGIASPVTGIAAVFRSSTGRRH